MKQFIFLRKTVSALFFIMFFSLYVEAQSTYYNAGGPQFVSLAGDTFKSDLYYTPGVTNTYTNNTITDILNTSDDALFRTERSTVSLLGNWGYAVPVFNGTYTVKLYFAEIYFGAAGGAPTQGQAGKRVFDVSIEGALKLDNYDIFVAAGGAERAIIETFQNITVTDATLNIDFAPSVNKAKISAIQIIATNVTPPSNTAPTFSVSGNINVSEDFAGTQTVTVTPDPVPPAETGQTVTYTLSPPSVSFANVSINSTTGLVSITKVTNGNGSQSFAITANDGQASNNIATKNFTLTVSAVNDPPAFALSGNITVNKNFATTEHVNVTAGVIPADETGQSVTYSLAPPSIGFANVSINSLTGQVTITSVSNTFGSQLFTVTANDGQALNNTASQSFTLTVNDSSVVNPTPNALCYNSGGAQYISTAGDTFRLDALYTAGTANYTNNSIPDILNTTDDLLFRTERNATTFGYDIPVANGTYTVKLYFAEIYYGATGGNITNPPHTGKRVFNAALEGTTVLNNYDIYAEVGAETAVIKTFSNILVNDGNLDIDFTSITNKAKVNAICIITQSTSGNTPPLFITSGNVNVSEDFAGTQTVTVTPNPVPVTETGQVVTYSISPPSVSFANVSINSTNGNVSITKVTNGNGSQLFTITANDGQVSNNIATQNFTLTVNAVNDAPAFTLNKGSVIVTKNFATTEQFNVIPGAIPSDESGQSVSYSLNPPSVAFANVSISSSTGQVSITSVSGGIGTQLFTITASDGQASNNTATQSFTLTVNEPSAQKPIHINCGGPQFVTAANDTFASDVYFPASGTFTSSNNLISDILNTTDDALFRTERYASDFTYTVPVQNGTYTVKLYFAEIFYGATGGNNTPPFNGKRVFDVSIEGNLVRDNYDIFVAAGGAERAIIEQIDNVVVNDGNVTINLAASVNNAKISGISIISNVVTDLPPTVSITNPSNGASFIEGANIQIDANASDDVGITNVEFYEGINLIGSDNSSPYSFNWTSVPQGNYSLTAKAHDSYGHTTTSAPLHVSVVSDLPPTVSISSPSEGATFFSPASITINANANDDVGVTRVDFYEGVNLFGSDNSSPFSYNWNNVSNGNYSLTAKAFDTKGASTTSGAVNISVTTSSGTQSALFVAGSIPLNNGDQGVVNRLQALGFTVTTVLAATSTSADANGKNIVLISATVLSSSIGNKFTNVSVPLICWEQALFDDLGLASASSGNSGSTSSGITQLNITGAGHPLAAGLTNGLTSVYTSAQIATWGKPNINSIKIATISGSTTQIAIFGYESGAAMVSGNAPARRVGFFLHDVGAAFMTAAGTALLDAAITWAANSTPPPVNTPPSVSISNPLNGATFSAPANITIDANASDPDLGGSISKVEFYEGLNILSTDLSSPFSFSWTNVPAGSYSLTAKAFDNLNASTTSSAINITVNSASNNPPLVSLVTPTNGATFTDPATVTIAANAFDPDLGGSISKVEFYEGLNLLSTDLSIPYTFDWTNVTAGNYSITAKAFDNLNASTTSTAASITVNAPTNTPPSVSITNPLNGNTFLAPATITISANANDIDLGGSISKVEFYEGLNLLGTDISSPFSFDWTNVPAASYSLTAKAFDNLNASTTSSAVNITVNPPANNPPSVSITSPINGNTFLAPATITISANANDIDLGGSISKVEFYEGSNLLGTDISSPFSFDWSNVPAASYSLTAKAFDNLNASATSSAVNITVNNPSAQGTILLIVGSLTLNSGDIAIKTRIESLGYSVDVKLGTASITADASGKKLVLISSTITSGQVGNKFTNVAVPVINCEQALLDDLKMTSTASGNSGTFTNQAQLNIIGAGHPLAAGLPNGLATVCVPGQTFSWGVPNANSLIIATYANNTANPVIFGYETNAVMFGLNAPAKRLGFFLENSTAAFLNINGLALFDAAINWALSTAPPNTPPSVNITNPSNGATFTAPASITIDANAFDSDGSISKVEFYEGLNLLSTDNSTPFSFNWTNVAAGNYSLTAKAFDNLNSSTTSAAINITVNANNPPSVSISNPANGATFIAPASITISANASDPDLGGSISKVEFYEGLNLLSTDLSSPFSFNWTNVSAGNYSLTAKAYDNLNSTTTSAAINITVNANNPPSVSITSPANGGTFIAPANITINANASDPDAGGSISKVEFYQGVTLLNTDNSSPFSFNWTNVPVGNYSLTAKAYDNLNLSTTSTAVNITVNPAPNNPPIVSITSPANGSSFLPPASFTISASASDPDAGGSISKVEFYQGATLMGTDMTAPYSLSLSGVPAGNYQFTAKAFDNLNVSTTSAVVNVSVNATGNLPPIVFISNPLNGATFTTPTSIAITAEAFDPDGGGISKVEFYQNGIKLGTTSVLPFSFTWNNIPAGSYQLTAKAFDNLNASSISAAVNITVNNPIVLNALFVVGNITLNTGDAVVKNKLENMGYTVTAISDAASTSTDATGKTLVLVSSTVVSANVNTKFTNVNVPVLTWESGILDDLKMTGTASTEYGTVFNQTQINIIGAGHALAGGLPNGLAQVYSSIQTITWGKPNGNAAVIATVVDNPSQICLFGYETGAFMFGMNAPARRAGLFLSDKGPATFNSTGMQLLEAAINWAVGSASKRADVAAPIAKQDEELEISIYPNPSKGIINLKIDNAKEGVMNVRIFNQLGQLVLSDENNISSGAYANRFDLNSMPSGLYLMQLMNGQNKLTRTIILSGK